MASPAVRERPQSGAKKGTPARWLPYPSSALIQTSLPPIRASETPPAALSSDTRDGWWPEKGVDLLLEAVAGMKGSWRLVILGGGPEREGLELLARRLGLDDQVIFEGWLPSLRLPAFYRGLDALVVPSRSQPNWVEQFGRVLIEAMACGVPVLGSTCGEIPQVVGEAGLIFPEDDATALRERLVRLMRDADLWADLSRRGRERVLAHFTQAHVAAQTVAVYRELMGETDKL